MSAHQRRTSAMLITNHPHAAYALLPHLQPTPCLEPCLPVVVLGRHAVMVAIGAHHQAHHRRLATPGRLVQRAAAALQGPISVQGWQAAVGKQPTCP